MALGHKEQEAIIDKILEDFNSSMTSVMTEVQKLLNAYMINNDVTALSSLQFDIVFNDMLTQAGYYTAVNKLISEDYNQLLPLIKNGFALGGLDAAYTQADLAIIQALKALQTNQYSVLGSVAGTSLRESLYGYSLSNWTKEDMAAQIALDLADTDMAKYSKTYANTLIGEYQQGVIDAKAKDLNSVWLYVGVNDGVTRDYCRCVLNQNAYFDDSTKNKIQSAKERKYNCRHRLRAVSEDYAISQGFVFKSSTSC